MSADHTATTEDAARVRERALKRAYCDRQTPIQEDDAWAFGEGVRAGIDAAAGLLATARPDTTREQIDVAVGGVLFNAMNHVATNLDDYLAAELARLVRDYTRPAHGHTTTHVKARIHALTTPGSDQ